jgi:tRNA A-37 threonylcarbamoyl transferase component Bud32
MGEVWLARAGGPVDKTVVLKRMRRELLGDEAARSRFVDEARVALALSHPHLVPVFELGEEGGEYFLVMEYVRGGDLSRIAGAPLAWQAVALLGSQLCDALAYVHARKDRHGAQLVHGDVTPHNVLLSREGHALLGDFGLARFGPHDRAGTRRYQSPEQARGEPFDGRADLYALALVLCEAATGKPAYDRDGARAAEQAKVGIVPPLDGVHAPLAAVLRHALAAAPDARPATASALRDQLDALLDGNARAAGRAELVSRVAAAGEGSAGTSRLALTEMTRAAFAPSRRWLWVALGCVVAVVVVWQRWPRPAPAVPAPVVAPSPAPVVVVAPSPVAVVMQPQKKVMHVHKNQPAPTPPPPAPPQETAQLDLNAVPWAHVRIDGHDRGDTPLLDVVLPAGTHRIELINEPLGVRRELAIELHPGEHARRVETLSH